MAQHSYGNGAVDRICRELFWEVEQRLIMHKLAKDYFGFRAFWVQSWPLMVVTTSVTIVAFTEYGSIRTGTGSVDYDEYTQSRKLLFLSLGILGLLSAVLAAMIINNRHQSQHDMHVMAEKALSKICQAVRFPERPGGDDGGKIVEHVNTQKAIFMAITSASPNIPPKIAHAFRDLEYMMNAKPFTFRAIQYERFYYSLWKLFTHRSSGCFLWPLVIPEVNISTSFLGKMVNDEYKMYSRGLEKAKRRNFSRISFEEEDNDMSQSSFTAPSSAAEV